MIHAETLYWLLSTIPQVLAALVGILAAFAHFRISGLQNYIIGAGQSILDKWQIFSSENGYQLSETEKIARDWLLAAVNKRNIYQIQKSIDRLNKNEPEAANDHHIGNNIFLFVNGLNVYQHDIIFLIYTLKQITIYTTIFAFSSIVLSLTCLALIDIINDLPYIKWISLILISILVIITLYYAFNLIYKGFKDRAMQEYIKGGIILNGKRNKKILKFKRKMGYDTN